MYIYKVVMRVHEKPFVELAHAASFPWVICIHRVYIIGVDKNQPKRGGWHKKTLSSPKVYQVMQNKLIYIGYLQTPDSWAMQSKPYIIL